MKRTYYTFIELSKTLKSNVKKIREKFNCNGHIVNFSEYCQIIKNSASWDKNKLTYCNDFFTFIEEPNKDNIKLVIDYRSPTDDFEILIAAETSLGAGCCSLFVSKRPTAKEYIEVVSKLTGKQLKDSFC